MNKEIKFRVWDIHNKIMRYTGEQYYLKIDSEWMLFEKKEDAASSCSYQSHDHLMQSTGLKDKNGVEIYEGDIVLVDEYYTGDSITKSHNAEVVFYEGCYMLLHPSLVDGCVGDHMLNNRLTIIGNVHENSELIK